VSLDLTQLPPGPEAGLKEDPGTNNHLSKADVAKSVAEVGEPVLVE